MQALDIHGARSRNRTGTPLRAGDFKSHASTSFAIRAVARSRDTGAMNGHQPGQCLKQGVEYIHPAQVKQERNLQKNRLLRSLNPVKKHAKSGIYSIRSLASEDAALHFGTCLGGAKTNMAELANQLIFNDLSSSVRHT